MTIQGAKWMALLGLGVLAGCPSSGGGGGSSPGGGNPPPSYDADLTVSSVTFTPDTVEAGQPVLVTDVVRHTGNEAVPAFRVGVYLSSDPVIDEADVLLGFRTIPGLDPQNEDTGGGQLTIPIETTAGAYYVGAMVDDEHAIGEVDETNNWAVAIGSLTVTPPILPDLIPVSVTFSPLVIDAGEQITVDDVVENHGETNSGNFQVGIYLSSDASITTADTLLGVREVSDLAPANGDAGSGAVTVPSSTPAGIYYVGVVVDDVDAVYEQSEGNNAAIAGATLEVNTPPMPDLVPTHVTVTPSGVNAGGTIQVSEGVLNQGVAAAQTFHVGVYLSADSLIEDTDILLGYRTVAFLADGQTSDVEGFSLQIPAETTAGTYWVGSWCDYNGVTPELLEANNTLVAPTPISIDVPPLPNLKPSSFSFSPAVVNVDEGQLLNIDEVVANIGTASAGTFRVGVYISPNSVITPSDVLITSRMITALGSGGTSGSSSSITLPSGLSDGSYYLGVIADDESAVGEITEGDNVFASTTTVDIVSTPDPQPDLAMLECSYQNTPKPPGASFQVVTRVTNEGNLSASSFHVGIYLSTDETITPDDVLLGERLLLTGLSAGFSNVASAPVTIPANQPDGTYYVGAYADSNLVVVESEENDNDLTTPGTLTVATPPPPRPELYVKEADHDVDQNIAPGEAFTVDEVIRNKGSIDASAFRVGYYLSEDSTITTDDVLLGTRTLAGLTAGTEDSFSMLLTVPPGTANGDYTVGVIADDLGAITENDEDDNDRSISPKLVVVQ